MLSDLSLGRVFQLSILCWLQASFRDIWSEFGIAGLQIVELGGAAQNLSGSKKCLQTALAPELLGSL